MRAPLFATFLPQILLSLALGVGVIVMFVSMHQSAITTTMENSVKDSLRFAEQRLSTPFTRMVYDTRLLKEHIDMHNAYAWIQNQQLTTLEVYRPFIEMCQQLIRTNNGTYAFIYQPARFPYPYPTATNSPLDNQDYGWGSTGSGYDYSMNMVNYTTFNLFNLGVEVTYPVMDLANIVANPPDDHRQTTYIQAVAKLTNTSEDREGKWGDVDMWVDRFDGTGEITLYVLYTFSIPLTWDPFTGQATSAVSIDMDCATWLVGYINNLNVVATEFTLVEPSSMQVLASSFAALRPGYNRKNMSNVRTWVLWSPLSSPEPRLTNAMNAIADHTNALWTAMPEHVHVFPDGSDDIFGARAMRESGLNLVLISVTRRSHFFTEGDTAARDAIIISCVLMVISLVLAVATAEFLRRPLKRLGYRMQLTASLNDEVVDDTLSVVAEVAEMQIAYEKMKAELRHVKSFLPQSILQTGKRGAEGVSSSEYSSSGLDTNEIMLKSCDDAEGYGVDANRVRAAINHFTCQDCAVVVMTVAYNAPIGTASHSICVEVLLDAVIRAAARHRGVVEQMKPHQVIVSFGARRKISNPANCALKFALLLNAVVTIPEVEASILLDRGTFFIGSCGSDDLRQETITSVELDALISLGPLVHSKHRVPIAATDRIAPSLTEHCAVFPIDNLQWGSKSPVHLYRVVHIEASLLAACDGRILSRLKRGFGLMCNGNHENALRELKEGQELLQHPNKSASTTTSGVPEAVEQLYAATGKAFTELLEISAGLAESSQAYARRYLGWPTLEGPAPLLAEFDPNRCEILEEEHEAPLRLQNQLQQLTKMKESRVPRFGNPFSSNTASANASGLFEMAFAVEVDAPSGASGGGSNAGTASLSVVATLSEVTGGENPEGPGRDSPKPLATQYLRHWRRGEHVLGKGTFGSVYRALNDNGSIAAMKILPLCATATDLDDLKKELVVTAGQRHENLVQFVDAEVGSEELVVIMELLPGGSLESLVNDFGSLPPRVIRRFVVDILRGLSHLHRVGIVHCDVKPQNILVGVDGVAKVADFGSALHPGFAANHGEDDGGDLKIPGTPAYMAPEVARGGAPTPASDIWSFGVMLHELFARKRPFSDQQNHQMDGGAFKCISVVGGIRDEGEGLRRPPCVDLPSDLDDREATELFLQACLVVDPQRRPTCEKLLTMEYLL